MRINYRIYNLFTAILIAVVFTSCGVDANTAPDQPDEPVITKQKLTADQDEAISYFLDITLGFEFGDTPQVTRKWNQKMKLFVGGHPSEALSNELNNIIEELNELTSKSNFSISITADSLNSNAYLYFGSGISFATLVPGVQKYIAANWGLFHVRYDGDNHIKYMAAYVDTKRAKDLTEQKHLLREELTQSLGFGNDSPRYSTSIFQSDPNTKTTYYSTLDREVIELLYNPAVTVGLDREQSKEALQKIVEDII